ncbi:MAG: substrate-binding domain-containing protein [Acidobacteriota bacterium]
MRNNVLFLVACLLAPACSIGTQPLVLATTTSVGNSGLLDSLTPQLRHDLSIDLRAHLVGSGLSLHMLEEGQADVAISHAPQLEAAALAKHPGWTYQKLMYNDFIIVGPAADPAHVRDAGSAAEAMRRISTSGARFASRGDQSGTHERERLLWQAAGTSPEARNLITTAQGMAATLRAANATSAYTLSDRATFAQLEPVVALKLLLQNDPVLLNTYAVMVPDRALDPAALRAAQSFATWLASGHGRELVTSFRVRGAPAFHVWPAGRPGSRPEDLPR